MFDWLIIGTLVGLVMGVTGAGAAMVSVPLFILLKDFTFTNATLCTLFTVFLGSLMNWVIQISKIQFSVSVAVILSAWIASWGVSQFKYEVPQFALISLFAITGVYSLYSLWKKNKPVFHQQNLLQRTIKSLALGLGVGTLITLTGLGGGFLIVPFLVGIVGLPMSSAVPTSLFVITLNSIGSALAQYDFLRPLFHFNEIGLLFVGTTFSALLVKNVFQKIPAHRAEKIRKNTLSFVIFASVITVVLREVVLSN